MSRYDFSSVEAKWQKYWDEHDTFKASDDHSKKKFYALVEFPYPSGHGMHVGHIKAYSGLEVVSRKRRLEGYNVLFPIGFDAYGLPTENTAIKENIHPRIVTDRNIEKFTNQLRTVGFSFDWSRVVDTTDESYYKWTQWIFLKMFEKGLVFRDKTSVNYCPSCKVVLSNEDSQGGKCDVCHSDIIQKTKEVWYLRITEYADKLLEGLETVDYLPNVKLQQQNWIGKSTGVEVEFEIVGGGKFSIFTTCIETIYGITFMVLAPDGAITESLLDRVQNREEVQAYIDETKKKNDMDRTELNKTKSGCELKGVTCINPVNGREVRMFIGDFVLASYGTGAVMAVPSHDQRDFEYAIAHNIDMLQVIDGNEKTGHLDVSEAALEKQSYLGKGYKLINSEEFTGMTVEEAKEAITQKLEKMGIAKRTVNYHFREWIFARQRYWGEPVPVVHGEDGNIHVLDDSELPLILPELDDYKGKNGKAPLENATEWKKYDKNGVKGTRETSTMPGSAGSSWYYFRYIDPHNDKEFANQELLKHWMPVDLYIGGPEHAVGHLIYSRIWNRYLYDKGLAPTKEPFKKLVHQGMILGENGIKMGKRFPEFVVNPSDIVRDYGADTLRLYEMFMGPLEVSKPWSKNGVEGARKFLNRVWNFFTEPSNLTDTDDGKLAKVYNQTVKKVTDDFEQLAFNTAISQMMIFVNAVYKNESCPKAYAEGLIKMLSCISPHIGEEIWSILGHSDTIAFEPWPTYDPAQLVEDVVEIVVQINGKVKAKLNISVDADKDSVIAQAKQEQNIAALIDGKTVVKEIYVPKKLVNIVVK